LARPASTARDAGFSDHQRKQARRKTPLQRGFFVGRCHQVSLSDGNSALRLISRGFASKGQAPPQVPLRGAKQAIYAKSGDSRLSYLLDFMVPRGGIEPPTRGFSVLCSTN
jgi:hypothetical protein